MHVELMYPSFGFDAYAKHNSTKENSVKLEKTLDLDSNLGGFFFLA